MRTLKVDMYEAQTGRWLKSYSSIKEAAESLNISRALISYCLNGKVRRAKKKYYFIFVNERW